MRHILKSAAPWLAIVLVAVALRLAAGAWWQSRLALGQRFGFGDSDGYWVLGQAIAAGKPYEYGNREVFRTPGYPTILAALFRIGGWETPVFWARALNAVIGGVTAGAVGWWATQLLDRRVGLVAGAIAAVYPGAVAMGAFVLSEAPFCLFMVIELSLWGMAWRTELTGRAKALALLAGAAGGFATLIRPSWILFTFIAALVSVIFDKCRWRALFLGSLACIALCLVMLPWWVRNSRISGHFVPTTLQVGASLYDGLNLDADGSSNMDFRPYPQTHNPAVAIDNSEYGDDNFLRTQALTWAKDNPRRVLELAVIKFSRMWNIWPNDPGFRSWPVRLVVMVTYVPLLILGLVGAWQFSARGWPYVLAWLPAVYFTMLHMVFVSSIRYREPAMLALIVLAAGVVTQLARTPKMAPP